MQFIDKPNRMAAYVIGFGIRPVAESNPAASRRVEKQSNPMKRPRPWPPLRNKLKVADTADNAITQVQTETHEIGWLTIDVELKVPFPFEEFWMKEGGTSRMTSTPGQAAQAGVGSAVTATPRRPGFAALPIRGGAASISPEKHDMPAPLAPERRSLDCSGVAPASQPGTERSGTEASARTIGKSASIVGDCRSISHTCV
jgi:hypothetical protein